MKAASAAVATVAVVAVIRGGGSNRHPPRRPRHVAVAVVVSGVGVAVGVGVGVGAREEEFCGIRRRSSTRRSGAAEAAAGAVIGVGAVGEEEEGVVGVKGAQQQSQRWLWHRGKYTNISVVEHSCQGCSLSV